MDVARFIVDAEDGVVVNRHHYPQGTPVAFTALGETYARLKNKLRAEDPWRDPPGQGAIVLDRLPYRPGGHAAGLRN
jgi:hypothetical protein